MIHQGLSSSTCSNISNLTTSTLCAWVVTVPIACLNSNDWERKRHYYRFDLKLERYLNSIWSIMVGCHKKVFTSRLEIGQNSSGSGRLNTITELLWDTSLGSKTATFCEFTFCFWDALQFSSERARQASNKGRGESQNDGNEDQQEVHGRARLEQCTNLCKEYELEVVS